MLVLTVSLLCILGFMFDLHNFCDNFQNPHIENVENPQNLI